MLPPYILEHMWKHLLIPALVNAVLFSILCIYAYSLAYFKVIYGTGFLPTFTKKKKKVIFSSFFKKLLCLLMETLLFARLLFMQELFPFSVLILKEICWFCCVTQ